MSNLGQIRSLAPKSLYTCIYRTVNSLGTQSRFFCVMLCQPGDCYAARLPARSELSCTAVLSLLEVLMEA
jgi:hypothetical protein